MVAAGDGIIGEHHVIKWPIARILIIPRDNTWNPDSNTGSAAAVSKATPMLSKNQKALKRDSTKKEMRGEILLRYQHTPAVGSSRTLLVFTQPRTRGMCSVLDFWPTDSANEDKLDNQKEGTETSNRAMCDLSWFEPL